MTALDRTYPVTVKDLVWVEKTGSLSVASALGMSYFIGTERAEDGGARYRCTHLGALLYAGEDLDAARAAATTHFLWALREVLE